MGALTQCSWPAAENRPALPTWTVILLRSTSTAASLETAWAPTAAAMARNAAPSGIASRHIGINPAQVVLEQSRRKKARRYPAECHARAILPLSDVAHPQRPVLNVSRASPAQQFVAAQRGLDGALGRNAPCQHQAILQRHSAPLTEIRRAGMRSVAQQSDASGGPSGQGRKIVGAVFEDKLRGA